VDLLKEWIVSNFDPCRVIRTASRLVMGKFRVEKPEKT
jgi:hypothetical protein